MSRLSGASQADRQPNPSEAGLQRRSAMRIGKYLLFVLLVPLWASLLTQAQDHRGSIQGRITDASKGVIPGVSIKVVNDATNVQTETISNDEGAYLVALLEPGTYTATVEYPAFKTQVMKGITVRTGDRLTIHIQLEIGESADSVTVSANTTILETNTAEISQVVDRKFLDFLYIPNRNPVELAKLTPGVYGGGGSFSSSEQHQFTVNGGGDQTGGNAVTVDGGSITMPRQFGAMSVSLPGDAVEEVRVQTTMFDAAYGQSNGGALIYSSRGGTNDLHGSFEWFYRNEALNANTWMNNKNGLTR
ncbi:MAG: carboxypeptidase regulatory-like domain-containing protein, partial [Acidobacteria bacterium]